MHKDNRKVVLFIIEGASDKWYIKSIYDKCDSLNKKFRIMFIHLHGDITSQFANKENTVKKYIEDAINRKLKRENLRWPEIEQIVHVVDTDGAYIAKGNIKVDSSKKRFFYTEEYIINSSVDNVIQRNGHKQKILDVLIDDNPPKGKPYQFNNIPYHVYYMSCNIEHVFYGKEYMSIDGAMNEVNDKKTGLSITFQENAAKATDSQVFLRGTIFNPEYTYPYNPNLSNPEQSNYINSWKFIKEGTNSLKRMTNLNLFFRQYMD